MRINQGWKAHMQNPNPICATLWFLRWSNPGFHHASFWTERGWKVATSSRYNVNVKPCKKKKKRLAPLRCQTGQSNHMVWAQTFISQIEILLVSAEMSRCYPSPFLINSFVFLLDRYVFAQVTVDSADGSRRSWLKSCSSVSQQNARKRVSNWFNARHIFARHTWHFSLPVSLLPGGNRLAYRRGKLNCFATVFVSGGEDAFLSLCYFWKRPAEVNLVMKGARLRCIAAILLAHEPVNIFLAFYHVTPLQTGTSGIPSIFERVSREHIFIQGRAKGGKVNWVKKSRSATGRQCCAITEYASRQRNEEEKKNASSQEIKCIHASLFEKKQLLRSSSSSFWYVTHHSS